MSQFTSESIKNQMAEYDSIVRSGVNDGNLSKVIELEDDIVGDLLCLFNLQTDKNST